MVKAEKENLGKMRDAAAEGKEILALAVAQEAVRKVVVQRTCEARGNHHDGPKGVVAARREAVTFGELVEEMEKAPDNEAA